MPASELAASAEDHDGDEHHGGEHSLAPDGDDHAHGGAADVDDPSGAAHAHRAPDGDASGTTAAEHGHLSAAAPTDQAAPGHDDHGAGDAEAHDAGTSAHANHSGADHTDHEPGMDGDHHHATACSDDHPETRQLVTQVQGELATVYKDIAALVALGYHPYFDSLVPGGWPPGGEGISHWINPNYIDDGVVLDPQRPETILLDDWNWPIGVMFINDPGVPPVPVYVNDDGTACSPWHPHTDAPARFGWYYYRAMYDRSLEGEVPEQTPEMMHVWAVPNPAGAYAAHDYPPREVRSGPPGPIPSYFSEVTIPG